MKKRNSRQQKIQEPDSSFMNTLIKFRTKVEEFYIAHRRVAGYILRAVILFLCMLIISSYIGFNEFLSQTWVVAILALVLAFIPIRFIMMAVVAYTAVQIFYLSIGIGVVTTVILVVMYLLYFRFAGQYGYLLMLLPLLYFIRLPLVAVLVLAALGPAISVITVIFGTVFYYLIHYIDVHAVVFASTTGSAEFEKAEMLLQGLFTNSEFLTMLIVMFVVFMIVHFVKRANYSHSYELAIAVGTGVYIVMALGSELLFGAMTTTKLLTYCIGGLISGALAILLTDVIKPLDYSRTETVEFEDDEYNYYVKAVPKTAFKSETVSVKKINKRKNG